MCKTLNRLVAEQQVAIAAPSIVTAFVHLAGTALFCATAIFCVLYVFGG